MKKIDKIELIQKIARDLQARMTFREIDAYLEEFEIDTSDRPWDSSKYEYATSLLAGRPNATISEMADELKIALPAGSGGGEPEFRFWKLGHFRIFISHTSEHKDKAARLASVLADRGCTCFVAHEDIKTSAEWRQELLRALRSADALAAILTADFHGSEWTDQEVGIALGLGKVVVPIMADQKPYGFMEQFQGKPSKGKTVGHVAEKVVEAISTSPLTSRRYADVVIGLMSGAKSAAELKEWVTRIKNIEAFDLAALRAFRDQLSDGANTFDHITDAITHLNELFETKGIEVISSVTSSGDDFDDEIPF